MTDYYQTLGVLDQASDVVIHSAYQALSKHHQHILQDSTTNPVLQNQARLDLQAIEQAYQILRDPIKRKEYDSARNHNPYELGKKFGKFFSKLKN